MLVSEKGKMTPGSGRGEMGLGARTLAVRRVNGLLYGDDGREKHSGNLKLEGQCAAASTSTRLYASVITAVPALGRVSKSTNNLHRSLHVSGCPIPLDSQFSASRISTSN